MTRLSIAMVQTSLAWEDAHANRDHFTAIVNEVRDVDLIVLPEMFSTGFSMRSSALAETMDGETVTWMKAMSYQKNASLCGSVIIEDSGNYYNRFLLVDPAGKVDSYDKRHLFRMSTEDENYTGGQGRPIFELNGFRLLPQVCYDLRFPVFSRNDLGDAGRSFDVMLYVANWPAARREHWRTLLAARAIENLSYVVGVNRIGVDGNEVTYSGDSLVVDYNGKLLADAGDKDSVIHVELERDPLEEWRTDFPAWKDADPFTLKQ